MNKKYLLSLFSVLFFCGCSSFLDAPRNILGFSRRDVEASRVRSSYQVYQVETLAVFNAIIAEFEAEKYYIFTKDEAGGFIMVMGIPGVVDTTEVGIFLTPMGDGQGVKVEVSSRSTPAKRVVAALLFSRLSEKFQ